MKKGSKYVHDYRYTHADRAEIYESLIKNPKSTLASPEQYARIPLKGMPSPTGKVYRGDEVKEKIFNRLSVEQIGELADLIVDMIKQNGGLHLNIEQVLAQYCRSDFKDTVLISDADDIENRNKEMDEKTQTLVKRKYL